MASLLTLGALTSPARAQQTPPEAPSQIDLRSYAPPILAIGDFETFEDQFESVSLATLKRVTSWKTSGRKMIWENLVNGLKVGTTQEFTKGHKVFRSNVKRENLKIVPAGNRERVGSSVFAWGLPQRSKDKLTYRFQGELAARARINEKATYVGTDDVTTPAGTFEDAVRIERISNTKLSFPSLPDRQRIRITQTQWLAEGIGIVLIVERTETFLNGVLQIDSGEISTWLVDATSNGVSVMPDPPPPDPDPDPDPDPNP